MDLRKIGLEAVDWIRLALDRDRWRAVVSAVMNLRVFAPRRELSKFLDVTILRIRIMKSVI
jgi:CRISPR/Cas system-associated protein Cas7 (RAMP superfamily)